MTLELLPPMNLNEISPFVALRVISVTSLPVTGIREAFVALDSQRVMAGTDVAVKALLPVLPGQGSPSKAVSQELSARTRSMSR